MLLSGKSIEQKRNTPFVIYKNIYIYFLTKVVVFFLTSITQENVFIFDISLDILKTFLTCWQKCFSMLEIFFSPYSMSQL